MAEVVITNFALCTHFLIFWNFGGAFVRQSIMAPYSDAFHICFILWKKRFFLEKTAAYRTDIGLQIRKRSAPPCQISRWSVQRVASAGQKNQQIGPIVKTTPAEHCCARSCQQRDRPQPLSPPITLEFCRGVGTSVTGRSIPRHQTILGVYGLG